jgi:hypothetical protein
MIDLGIGIAGWMRLTVKGNAGDKLLVQTTEKPDPHSSIDQTTSNFQQFGHVLKRGCGNGGKSLLLYGVSIVKVTATAASGTMPHVKSAVGVIVHTGVSSAGSWRSSNSPLNDIDAVWRRTQLNNMHGSLRTVLIVKS